MGHFVTSSSLISSYEAVDRCSPNVVLSLANSQQTLHLIYFLLFWLFTLEINN